MRTGERLCSRDPRNPGWFSLNQPLGELRLPSELTRCSRMWTLTSEKGGQSRAVFLGQDPQKWNLQTRPKTQSTLLSFIPMRLLESSLYLSKYHLICSWGHFLSLLTHKFWFLGHGARLKTTSIGTFSCLGAQPVS